MKLNFKNIMLRPFTSVTIQQVMDYSYNDSLGVNHVIKRNKKFTLENLVSSYEIESGWESHTNSANIKFPKNIQVKQGDALFKESGSYNVILGGEANQGINGELITIPPLLYKGDIITINDGYYYIDENDKDTKTDPYVAFQGYISNVKSDTPIEIECQDDFYLLKRTPFDLSVWNKTTSKGKTDLYSMCKHIIDLVNKKFYKNPKFLINGVSVYPKLSFFEIPNSIAANFSLGYLDIGDMTCAELLAKLKSQFHFESTFDNNHNLIFGATLYNESSAKSNTFFYFRDLYVNGILKSSSNIFPTKELEYSNKGDIVLSTVVQCKIITPIAGRKTKDGYQATKKTKLKVLVYWDIPTSTFKSRDLSKPGSVTPKNEDDGERHTCYYPVDLSEPSPTLQNLIDLGIKQLQKYYFTGFKGSFSTIGFPQVSWNDNVNIIDSLYSDRNGQYKVKKIKRKFESKVGGSGGITQEIFLDYLQQDVIAGKEVIRQIPKDTIQIYMR